MLKKKTGNETADNLSKYALLNDIKAILQLNHMSIIFKQNYF